MVVRTEEMGRDCEKRNDFLFYRVSLRLALGHCPSISVEADSDNGFEHRRWCQPRQG